MKLQSIFSLGAQDLSPVVSMSLQSLRHVDELRLDELHKAMAASCTEVPPRAERWRNMENQHLLIGKRSIKGVVFHGYVA